MGATEKQQPAEAVASARRQLPGRALRTRERLRTRAMELFLARGYEATTVGEIAEAAGVSQMTLFRHFPTKADLVMTDEYDPVIVRAIADQPRASTPLRRIHAGVRAELREVCRTHRAELLARVSLISSTPELTRRISDNLLASRSQFEQALTELGDPPPTRLEISVAAAVATACFNTAIGEWVQEQGKPDLVELVDTAFETVYAAE